MWEGEKWGLSPSILTLGRKKMKLDAIRFSIGPWDGRYSSVWRIWSNTGSDDVYLGVRTLLKYMKISLHQTGKFRVAFTNSYNQKMVEDGKRRETDRAFLKWDKIPVSEKDIMQALDIHFPLSALSLKHKPKTTSGKNLFLLQPDEKSLGSNDSVTVKVLFHRIHPNSDIFHDALKQKKFDAWFLAGTQEERICNDIFSILKTIAIEYIKRRRKTICWNVSRTFHKNGEKNWRYRR